MLIHFKQLPKTTIFKADIVRWNTKMFLIKKAIMYMYFKVHLDLFMPLELEYRNTKTLELKFHSEQKVCFNYKSLQNLILQVRI